MAFEFAESRIPELLNFSGAVKIFSERAKECIPLLLLQLLLLLLKVRRLPMSAAGTAARLRQVDHAADVRAGCPPLALNVAEERIRVAQTVTAPAADHRHGWLFFGVKR